MHRSLPLLALLAGCPTQDTDTDTDTDADTDTDTDADTDTDTDIDTDADTDTDTDADSDTDTDVEPIDPIAGIDDPVQLETGFGFTEGPLWRAAEGDLLFTDIPNDTIHRWSADDGVSVFRYPSGRANGLGFDSDGLLIACEHDNRRVSRTTGDGTIVPIADSYTDLALNSPNDNISRDDGVLYFTDPTYGIPGGQSQELDFQGVFRLVGSELTVEVDDMVQPNGIALSPDQSTIYISDSAAGAVRRYTLESDGSFGDGGHWLDTGGGGDGMAMDDEGNLYVTRGSGSLGVWVIAPSGYEWGHIPLPETPTNVSFGGAERSTLFITAGGSLYSVELNVSGLP